MITVVRDIIACDRCPFPVFPGEEVFTDEIETSHRDHWGPALPGPASPVYS